MGEAKRKRQELEQDLLLTSPLSVAKFNLYALGTRLSPARMMAEELSFWSDKDERLVGFVFRDTTDNDFGWIILARDKIGRFRSVKVEASLRSQKYAEIGLRKAMAHSLRHEDITELGVQGDEPNAPFDLFKLPNDTDPAKLHPYFRELLQRPGKAPARSVIKEIGPWLAPSDPHFVGEFQFTQFDQRLWELYLWAAFREIGFDVEQHEAPDFICRAPGIGFAVEATTVAPSTSGVLAKHPNPETPDEMRTFLADYMPMKFGSPLLSKINKTDAAGRHYWEREQTADKPFIVAIADFHKQADQDQLGSMTFTQSALWPYLYGQRIEWEMKDGELFTWAVKKDSHEYEGKNIPSGFFDQPGAEHVSAVLFSNAGTIAKFDRIGVTAGFAAPKHVYQRIGFRLNPDPNAMHGLPFFEDVSSPDYVEGWTDELQLFHNPNARVPLPIEWFNGISQFYFSEDDQYSIIPEHHVWSSMTAVMQFVDKSDEK